MFITTQFSLAFTSNLLLCNMLRGVLITPLYIFVQASY